MSEKPIHFEVLVRRNAAAQWALADASEDRDQAIRIAEQALSGGHVVAAKVTREKLDPDSRQFRSAVVFQRGDDPPARKGRISDPSGEPPPLCTGPIDLYTSYARGRIARLLAAWLRHHDATPFELLHRPDLVEQLDASGLELQHAIQKVAIPEAQEQDVSVHEVIRRYQRLVEAAVARLLRDAERDVFPDLRRGGLDGCIQAALQSAEPPYVLGVAIAQALATEPDRRAKLDRLLDWADAVPAGPGRELLLQVIAQPLGEMLELRETLEQLLGESLELGEAVALILRLVAANAVEALIGAETALADVFPAPPASVARLAVWLRAPEFQGVAAALARRALSDLQGLRRLHPRDPIREITTLRALAHVLVRCPRLVTPDDVHETFVGRSRHLVAADFVKVYVEAHDGGALGEAQALTHLAENIVGAANRRMAGGWLKTAVGALRFERDLMAGKDGPAVKLARLADLGRAIRRSGLPDVDQAQLAERLGAVAAQIEAQAGLVHAIARAPTGATRRLLILLRLATGETAPAGPVSERAKCEAVKLVRDPAARADLAAHPAEIGRVRDLMHLAGMAA